jgi:CBS-domain-containing membrane protein
VPGKVDWLARMLPAEGEEQDEKRVGDFAHDDVVRCSLDEDVGEVLSRIDESPYGFALVMADDGETLFGRLPKSAIEKAGGSGRAEDVMSPGPSTVRPDMAVDELRERLDERDLKTAVVSTPEGKLIGVVKRADLGA